jgi:excisionase family DNA binding protein
MGQTNQGQRRRTAPRRQQARSEEGSSSDLQFLLTPEQVAIRLGVPERWVWRALRDGRLKKRKVGKYVRIHPDDYEEFVASTCVVMGGR